MTSRRMMEKCGLAFRGETRWGGFDVIWYAKDRRDWEAEYKKLTAES